MSISRNILPGRFHVKQSWKRLLLGKFSTDLLSLKMDSNHPWRCSTPIRKELCSRADDASALWIFVECRIHRKTTSQVPQIPKSGGRMEV
jgi:hypothetical protein